MRSSALERGRLEFKTDDAGTLYLEWDKLTSLVANRLVEVVTSDGRRFLGTLGRANDRSISIVVPGDVASLLMMEVTMIIPIGKASGAGSMAPSMPGSAIRDRAASRSST